MVFGAMASSQIGGFIMARNLLSRRYSQQELKQLLTKYFIDEQLSLDEVVAKLGSSRRTISRWRAKFGLNQETHDFKSIVTNEDLKTQYLAGHSANFLANKYGVSVDTVIRHLRAMDVNVDKTRGMKVARHRMHDDLWPYIQKDLDNGALKQTIIRKYHITRSSLNALLRRKHYVAGIDEKIYNDLSDINVIISRHNYLSNLDRKHALILLDGVQRFTSEFGFLPTRSHLAQYVGLNSTMVCHWVKECSLGDYFQTDTHRSYLVLQIMSYLEKNHIKYELNNRKVISPLEIDIWVPKYNLGFEIDPASSHLTTVQNKVRRQLPSNYHQNKSLKCFEKGVRLVHIYDWQKLTEGMVLNYLQFPKFDFVNKTVSLDTLLITKDQLHKLGYCVYKVSQPEKHYVNISRHNVIDPLKDGVFKYTSVVYTAGKMYLKKIAR